MLLRFPVRFVRSLPRMSVVLCALCLTAFAADPRYAWGEEAQPAKPQEVAVGLYLNRLVRISHKEGTFDIDAWIWFRWKGGDIGSTLEEPDYMALGGPWVDGVAPEDRKK